MATDLQLDPNTFDLVLENGDLALISDGAEVAQSWKIRLLWVQGEYLYNPGLGIPWFSEIFRVARSAAAKRAILVDATKAVPGVRQLLKITQETSGHEGSLAFEIDTVYNTKEVAQI